MARDVYSYLSREARDNFNGYGDVAKEAVDLIDNLRAALQFAREWGISGKGYDASAAHSLAQWVDAGMTGDLPNLPAYLQTEQKGS